MLAANQNSVSTVYIQKAPQTRKAEHRTHRPNHSNIDMIDSIGLRKISKNKNQIFKWKSKFFFASAFLRETIPNFHHHLFIEIGYEYRHAGVWA